MELQEGLPQTPGPEATTLQLQPLSHSVDSKYDQALFLLRSTHTMSLPYKSIEELCHSTQSFVEKVIENVKDNISFLASHSSSSSSIPTDVAISYSKK